jgi:outer membrane protein
MKTMKAFQTSLFITALIILLSGNRSEAQQKNWTLEDCINFALEQNVQVKKADLSNDRNQLYSEQAKANRLPNLNASVRQNFDWNKSQINTTGSYGALTVANGTTISMNSSISVFNGMKISNKIKQSELDLESGHLYSETIKESVSLTIMNAFLQILYSQEQVKNAEKQIEATSEQLALAAERVALGVISQSDYLQIKSELANEKLTLANAQSQLSTSKVNLMQQMELPVDANFNISSPALDSLLNENRTPDAQEIYNLALGIKPQIKNAALTTESATIGVKIAKADALPSLSMDAGVGTGYSSVNTGADYVGQIENRISPSIGLSLSIPIFQKKQIKTNVSVAQIAISDAGLDEINTKNQLRKDIEQACQNVISAQSEYAANVEQMQAQNESNQVSTEKFKLGLMNSVDYLFEKTNLITAESKFLQSKYNLIFSYKVLDFYKGISLTL